MMQRKHPSEAMTGAPGALPGEAIRILTLIVAPESALPHCNASTSLPCLERRNALPRVIG